MQGLAADWRIAALTSLGRFHTFQEHFYPGLSGRNSAVECQLPKLDVTGSIPVARSKPFPVQTAQAVQFVQTVPERKSELFFQ